MKIRFKYMIMAAVAAALSLGTISCSQDSLDDLQGIYEAPVDLEVTGATLANKTKEGNLRTFILNLQNNQGVNMELAVVASNYFIPSNGYTPAAQDAVKNGNLVAELSTINGSNVKEGTLAIAQSGDDYTISKSVLFTTDGKAYRFKGAFTLPLEPDDPTALTLKTQYDNSGQPCETIDNGNGTYTLMLTTGGYTETFNWSTYQNEYTGEGNDLQIVFNLPDGKLHEGTYKPGEGYVAGYSFMNNAYEAWGVPAFEDYAGTIWYGIANGARTPASLVTSGDIVVKKNGSKYTILLDQGKGGLYVQYEGAISSLDPDGGNGGSNATELTYGGGVSWIAYGGTTIALGFASPGAKIEYNANYWSFVASGTGVAFNVEFYSADGTLAPGTYTPADQGSVAAGNWQKGYDNGWGGFGGSVMHVVNADVDTASALTEGTFVVEKNGDNYKITTTLDGVDYEYNGPITI